MKTCAGHAPHRAPDKAVSAEDKQHDIETDVVALHALREELAKRLISTPAFSDWIIRELASEIPSTPITARHRPLCQRLSAAYRLRSGATLPSAHLSATQRATFVMKHPADIYPTACRLQVAGKLTGISPLLQKYTRLQQRCIKNLEPILINAARRATRAGDSARFEDALQECRSAALLAVENYDPSRGTSLPGMVARYATNAIISAWRRDTGGHIETCALYEDTMESSEDSPGFDHHTLAGRADWLCSARDSSLLLNALRKGLATLPKDQAIVIRLAFGFDGERPHSPLELSRHLGMTAQEIARRYRAATCSLATIPEVAQALRARS